MTGNPQPPGRDVAAEWAAAESATGGVRRYLQEWCYVNVSAPNPTATSAGVTAIRILSSSGTTPATTGAPAPHHRPRRYGG